MCFRVVDAEEHPISDPVLLIFDLVLSRDFDFSVDLYRFLRWQNSHHFAARDSGRPVRRS